MAFYMRVLGQRVLGIAVLGSVSLLSGCGNFFSCEGKASCPTSGTTGTTGNGDYVYVSNSTSGTTEINEYSLASGTLTAITGSPFSLGYTPVAMVVAPKNGFLYVASDASAASPGVYVYTISSTGALSEANGGVPFFPDSGISSMDISPDGAFLFTVGDSTEGPELTEYPLDSSTGLAEPGNPLTFFAAGSTPFAAPATACSILTSGIPLSQVCTVKVSPNSNFVAVAVGGSGFETFTYNNGIPSDYKTQEAAPPDAGSADFSLAFDNSNDLYVASTAALTSFDGLGASLTQLNSVAFGTGTTDVRPRSVTVTSGSGFVYTANEGSSTISGFSLPGNGVMTPIPGTPIAGPTSVSALGVDSTGDYLVAAGYGSTSGLQVFSISSSGALTAVGTSVGTRANDNTVPVVMALSH